MPPVIKAEPGSGFDVSTEDGRFKMNVSARLQFRYTYEGLEDPALVDDHLSSFRLRRARLKVGGHGFQPWFKYYFEYDFPSTTLLDWRVSLERWKWLSLRFGQWKIEYNRERVDSSGSQLLVDRSIVNAAFTLDRQIGVELYGKLFEATPAFLVYHLGTFTGTGINETENDDRHHLYLGRLQWNFLGRDVPFFQGDPGYTEAPTAAIAVAAATNRTNRVRFPQSRNLGEAGQFRVDQLGQDFVLRYRGFSLQQEFHTKVVRDLVNEEVTRSQGGYVQLGVSPHTLIRVVPAPLELAARYAVVDPNLATEGDFQREITVGANWYFSKHKNKLTADVTRLVDSADGDETYVRVQWDVSF